MRSAIVLAGGRSQRFGERDKALAPVDGTPMLCHVVERVTPVVDEVVVNCRSDQRRAIERACDEFEVSVALDPIPDRGPVAGLAAGLDAVEGGAAVAVPCDMPRVAPTLLDRLFAARAPAAVVQVDGRRRPLPAVYDSSTARPACERALEEGTARLQDVLARLEPSVVDADEVDVGPTAFVNVNTPTDLRAVEAALGG